MGVSKYNSEGYYDPTAYEALAKITQEEQAARYRPLVFICLPVLRGYGRAIPKKQGGTGRFAADAGTIPTCAASAVPAVLIGRNGTGAGDFYGSGAAGHV